MKGKKVKGYMKGGDIGDSMPGIEGLDKKFGKSVADANKAAEAATAKRIKGVDLGTEEEQLKAIRKQKKDLKNRKPKSKSEKAKERNPKKNNTTKASPLDAPKPPMAGMGGAPKPPMGGMPPMGGAPKPPMGGMGMPPKKPPMPMMKKGGKVKKSGGKVRGCGIAKKGVRPAKMR